jgi:predicted O-methyltransferase YrrM
MRTLNELFLTPRMFYAPFSANNSVEGLNDMIQEIGIEGFTIVEIGSFSGVSSELFAHFCKRIYCVDIWTLDPTYQEINPDHLMRAEAQFDDVWLSHLNVIEPIQAFSLEAVKDFDDGELDMVYIDGRHDYPSVIADIKAWMPKIKKGGWLTGHDIDLDGERVLKAVTEVIGNDYKTYKDTSWAHQIK